MKKMLVIFAVVVLIGTVCLAMTKDYLAKRVVKKAIGTATGAEVVLDKVSVEILKTLVSIEGLRVTNPKGFSEEVMLDVPELYVNFNAGSLFKKTVHLEDVRLTIKEIIIVKKKPLPASLPEPPKEHKEQGATQPSIQQPAPPTEQDKIMPLFIDNLSLKLNRVVYKDFTAGESPRIIEVDLRLDQRFQNITDVQKLLTQLIKISFVAAGA